MQVRFEVFGARPLAVQGDDADEAVPPARALRLQVRHDVGSAVVVTVVLGDALAEPHASVLGRLHDDHLARPTRGVERLPITVFLVHP